MNETNIKKIKRELFKRLSNEYGSEEIYIFGSYAYGKPSVDSDIDIGIIVPNSDEPQYKRSRRGYAAIRNIDFPVEILVFTEEEIKRKKNVISSLASTILKKGIKLNG